jgi:hypothetical protein
MEAARHRTTEESAVTVMRKAATPAMSQGHLRGDDRVTGFAVRAADAAFAATAPGPLPVAGRRWPSPSSSPR